MAHGVPSFGSFRPQAVEREREERKEGGERRREERERHVRHRSERHHDERLERRGERHEHRKERHERHRHRDRHEQDQEAPDKGDDLFVVDRHGDTNAAQYGASKYVPRTERRSDRKRSSLPRVGEPSERMTRRSEPRPTEEYMQVSEEAVPETHPTYRDPYQATVKQRLEVDDDAPLFASDSPQEQSKRLHERLAKEPRDIAAWFALAQLQARLLGETQSTLHSKVNEATLANMQLAVLERAMEATKANANSLSLQLARLHIAVTAGIWTSERLESRWRSLLQDHIPEHSCTYAEYMQLWWSYLHFRKCDWSTFALDDLLGIYAEAMEAIRGNAHRCADQHEVHRHHVMLMQDWCNVLRKAGTCNNLHRVPRARHGAFSSCAGTASWTHGRS